MKKQKKPFIKDLEKKSEEYLHGWQICQADFENYKKQQEESQNDFRKFAQENLIMQILPVLDNFHASTDHIPESEKNSPWVAGIMHIQKQLEDVLRDNGVEAIETEVGGRFDHNIHEAIHPVKTSPERGSAKQEVSEVKNKSEAGNPPAGGKVKISKIVKKGYKIGDKVIRPATVTVE